MEVVMDESDWRLCTLCSNEVDLNHPDIEVLARANGGRTTVRDRVSGLIHILKRRKKRKPAEAGEEKS
jgi:hypothetical protein